MRLPTTSSVYALYGQYSRGCYLLQLADMMSTSGDKGLAAAIRRYLEADVTFQKLTAAKKHMVIMGGSIVEAMRTGKLLQVAGTQGSGEACGIFVGKHDPNVGIFTSRRADIDIDDR
jgi:hypothetical protein